MNKNNIIIKRKNLINNKYLLKASLSIMVLCGILLIPVNPGLHAAINEDAREFNYAQQPVVIEKILKGEENIEHLKNLISLIKFCDDVYGNLPERLSKGEKLVIFLDPAHGKLPEGQWQGSVTGRVSTIGLPEEYYSIKIARAFYDYVKTNNYLRIESTPDFMDVLDNKSEFYNNISFKETLKLASDSGAFIIVSEHLNNVASIYKKDGLVNIAGIHVTLNDNGTRYLTNVRDVYKGFLTLYNRYDASGFSRLYAELIKADLVKKGLSPNSWNHGTVADDRFIYFNNYPVSVIYESGFISNPQEESLFQNDDYCKKIAETHYTAMIDSIKNIFGIDISGSNYKIINSNYDTALTALKLSRIIMYYLNNGSPEKALAAVTAMTKLPDYKNAGQLAPYRQMEIKLSRIITLQKKAQALAVKKRYHEAYNNLVTANRHINDSPVYYQLNKNINLEAKKLSPFLKKRKGGTELKISHANTSDRVIITPAEFKKSTPVKTKTIILAINDEETLQSALTRALAPSDVKVISVLEKNLCSTAMNKSTNQAGYSKKIIPGKITRKQKISFGKGIYLVKINSKLQVKSVERVNRVLLDPRLFQNAEYMSNSYFSNVQTRGK